MVPVLPRIQRLTFYVFVIYFVLYLSFVYKSPLILNMYSVAISVYRFESKLVLNFKYCFIKKIE